MSMPEWATYEFSMSRTGTIHISIHYNSETPVKQLQEYVYTSYILKYQLSL